MLRLKRSSTDVMDLASVVADSARRQSSDHPLTISIEDDIPLVSLDFILMVQVLANLLGNVAAHTPPGTAVQLSVEKAGDGISITVADNGPGVAPGSCRTCSRPSSVARMPPRGASASACPSARASWKLTAGPLRHSSTARVGSR